MKCHLPPATRRHVAADKQFLQRQSDILRLLVRIEQPNYYEDQIQIGNSYDIESSIKDYKVSLSRRDSCPAA
jgi:hypothetical protein